MPEDNKWFITRTRYIPALWPVHAYFTWPVAEYMKVLSIGTIIHLFENGHCTGIWEKDKLEKLSRKMTDILIEKASDLELLRQKGIETGERLIKETKAFSDKSKQANLDDYKEFLKNFSENYADFIKDNMLYWFLSSQELEKRIEDGLKDYSEKERGEIFEIMSVTLPSYSDIEEEKFSDLLKLAQEKGMDSEEFNKATEEFSDSYFWFPYEYVGPDIWDKSAVIKRVKENLGKEIEVKDKYNVEEAQEECKKQFKLNPEIQNLFSILRTMILMQDDRKMINSKTCYYLNGIIFNELAKKLGITLEESRYIDVSLLDLFGANEKKFRDSVRKRTFLFMTESRETEKLYFEGEEVNKHLKELGIDLNFSGNVKEIKGSVANKGKVVGRVRILKTSQVNNFKEGEVIVTGMTTPDFVPLIKKCGAIITDEGGITSHASIVSRELNKPCIIGTKIATKVLKDGDLVEVDANNGIIKILDK